MVKHSYSECQYPGIVQLRVELEFLDVTVHKVPMVGLQFFEGVLK
jgi:hypothetical protein